MKNILSLLSLLFALFLLSYSPSPTTKLQFTQLKCDYYENPVGIENPNPTFSWIVLPEEQNQSQNAYQILVATLPELLTPDEADIWNSGEFESNTSVFVPFDGKKLQAKQKYWWKVKIWNQDNIVSDWSEPAFFEMGLQKEKNWVGAK